MKKIRRFMSLMLAMVMVLAMGMSAMAEETTTYTITIKDAPAGHTYEAYQIFAGDLVQDENDSTKWILSNVEWGTGIKEADKATLGDAAAKAKELNGLANDAEDVKTFAKTVADHLSTTFTESFYSETTKKYTISGLSAGYYLIKDKDGSLANKDDAYTYYMLTITTTDLEISAKSDSPKVEKKVKENTSSYAGTYTDTEWGVSSEAGYNDIADYSIGDTIPFAFYSKVPDMTYYSTYKYVFHDTLSSGLTFDANSVVITVGNTPLTKGTDYSVITENLIDGCTFHIEITNLKGISGVAKDQLILVKYNATLNANANIGDETGNTNSVILEYSNNPNDTSSTTKTPAEKVVVFTYELDVTKVDGSNTATKLANAEFKLLNAEGKYVTVDADNKVTGWKDTKDAGSTLTSDGNGAFKIIGLDAGTYKLEETKAPAGYNLLTEKVEIVITAETIEDRQAWDGTAANALTGLKITVDTVPSTETVEEDSKTTTSGNDNTGIVEVTVENNKGATLPSTGGVGTTMFYVVGGALVLVAVVLLVTRKRMSAEK